MIGYLKGIVVYSSEKDLIVLTEGGTGYQVSVTPVVASAHLAGEPVELFIETSVREDAIVLFGFKRIEEKSLFNMLREVNKIGPKTSLSILSSASVEEITFAIASGNSGFFKKISGVGPKTAERIIIDLKDKALSVGTSIEPADISDNDRQSMDASDGLLALGYNPLQIKTALNKISGKDKMRAEQIVREALRIINGKR
ncbi:MAG TPA: Holliday junction branch migration protein RuvA [bacterium]|nr:Holliday junction branch migration protein RuvA [bacterium]HPS29453.1 Holliday junction branch migration protein RuvA [bacterium]